MRAEVDGLQMSTVSCEMLAKAIVHGEEVGFRMQSQRNAALVGDDDCLARRAVETGNRLFHARKYLELLPGSNESADRTAIQHSVPI